MGETGSASGPIRILFICTGNICRSPTAEGVFRKMVEDAGLSGHVTMDSAGTHSYHLGEPPSTLAQVAALRRGYDISWLRARQLSNADCGNFDYLLAMDVSHYDRLIRGCAPGSGKIRLFMSFAKDHKEREVPDPYGGPSRDYDHVLDMIEDACKGLLEEVKHSLGLTSEDGRPGRETPRR